MGEACGSGAAPLSRALARAALWQSVCVRGAAPGPPGLGAVLPGRVHGRPVRAASLLAAHAAGAGRSVRLRRQLPAEAATRPSRRPLSRVARALCGARLTPVRRRCKRFTLPAGGRMLRRCAWDIAQCVIAQQAAQLPVGLGDAGGNAGRQRAELPEALRLAARTQCSTCRGGRGSSNQRKHKQALTARSNMRACITCRGSTVLLRLNNCMTAKVPTVDVTHADLRATKISS